jgi:hypothetical protein
MPNFYGPIRAQDSFLGHTLVPDQAGHTSISLNEKILVLTTLTTDHFSRRTTPIVGSGPRHNHLIVLGCSQVMGIGVENNETIPYFLGKLANDYRPYNYGVGAWGTGNIFAMLNVRNLAKEVSEKKGIAIYLFFDFHIQERSVANLASPSFIAGYPTFKLGTVGKPEYLGSMKDVFPWTLFFSKLLDFFPTIKNFLKEREWSMEERRLAVSLISGIRDRYLAEFRGGRFVLVQMNQLDSATNNLLADAGIERFHFFEQTKFQPNELINPFDGHYSAAGNRKISEVIYEKVIGL